MGRAVKLIEMGYLSKQLRFGRKLIKLSGEVSGGMLWRGPKVDLCACSELTALGTVETDPHSVDLTLFSLIWEPTAMGTP